MRDKPAGAGGIKNMRRRTRVTVMCAVLLLAAVMVEKVLLFLHAIRHGAGGTFPGDCRRRT